MSLLLLVPLVGFWPVFIGSESFYISYDNVTQFFPWYQKMSAAIHHGYLPIWDANALSGHSFVGEFQTGVFYPIDIVWFAVFGSAKGIGMMALEWLVIVHYVIASAAMFLLCRKLGFSSLACTVGALLYAYTGDFASRASGQTCIFFGNVYIPIAVLLALLSIEKRKAGYAALAGVTVGLQALAGHLEPASIGGLIVVAIVVGDAIRNKEIKFARFAIPIVVVAAFVTSSPQLFFGFQYLSNAYRWVMDSNGPIHGTGRLPFSDYADTAFSLDQFLNILDPGHHQVPDGNNLFIGCLPILLLIVGLSSTTLRKSSIGLLSKASAIAFLALFALLMLMGSKIPVAQIVYHIPFATAAVRELGRYAILIQLLMVLAVGAVVSGLDSSRFELGEVVRRPLGLIALALSIAYAMFVYKTFFNGPFIAILMVAMVLAVLFLKRPFKAGLVAILIACEVAVALPQMAQSTASATYPPKSFASDPILDPVEQCFPDCRVAILDDVFPSNIGDVYSIQTFYGKGATMYAPYYDLLGAGGFDPHGFVEDALNVRYILSAHALNGFKQISSEDQPVRYLYERPNVFPRVYSLTALQTHERKANDVIYRIVNYGDLESEFEITVPRAETVVFAEQFYPGWVVSVDGASSQMFAASINGSVPILRAVTLNAGMHRVRFDYPR